MCGFAGVISWDEKYRVTRDALAKMSACVAHRGPDGKGFYLSREHENISPDQPQVALAFRRLAILDPDPRSNQPFTDGRHFLVFNGEIYNFRELRIELSKIDPVYQWRTTGDTEVLLRSFSVWREKCVEKFNGMFAIAIWDSQENSLFLARDRMGQKPLFYTLADNSIAFASELSALHFAPGWSGVSTIDDESLFNYLNLGYVPGERTIYSDVRKLLPSTFIYGGAKRFQTQYFNHTRKLECGNENQDIRSLVDRAVQRQLVSDVSLGVFLSGGIDSSVIASAARKFGEVLTFSMGFSDSRYDETRFARRVAKHLGTRHHAFHVTPDAAADLPALAESFGEPFADSSALPTYYLARETRRYVKVALSGDGGDELFGGYDRYRALAISQRLAGAPQFAKSAMKKCGAMFCGSHPKSRRARLSRLFDSVDLSASQRYQSYVQLFDYGTIDALRGRRCQEEQWAADHQSLADEFDSIADVYSLEPVRAAMAIDLTGYLPDDLLTKVDRASMLHNLEVRSPFMDHELVQRVTTMPTHQLFGHGKKRLLREAFADDLPAWVFKRKKMGFAVPIGQWFRGPLRDLLRGQLFTEKSFAKSHFDMQVVQRLIDEHERSQVDHSQRLYALLMLELWWQRQSR